jgi:hypothetical protein
MLSCDTKILASPLTSGYLWMMDHNFPLVGYFQIVQVLRRRPMSAQAEEAWRIMDENYEARFEKRMDEDEVWREQKENLLVQFFAKVVLGAWAAREMAVVTRADLRDELPPTPRIVTGLRKMMAEKFNGEAVATPQQSAFDGGGTPAMFGGLGDADLSMSVDFGINPALAPYAGGFLNYAAPLQAGPDVSMPAQQGSFDVGMYPLDFSSMYGMDKPPGPW